MLLNENSTRAVDTPASTMPANCISCPGRASCAVSVHDAASKVKSSLFSVVPSVDGTFSGSTNSPCSPVLPIKRGGRMLGAGDAAVSAADASRMRAGRDGSVTIFSRVMIVSRSFSRDW